MSAQERNSAKIGTRRVRKFLPLMPLLLGCVLIYLGTVVRGLDFGSCPTMGFNGVTAPCFHNFPGTDIPITPVGNMIITVGAVLIAATLAVMLHQRFTAGKKASLTKRRQKQSSQKI